MSEPINHSELLRRAMSDSVTGRASAGPRVPEPEELASKFPEFQILAVCGRGGMSAVYKAIQTKLDRVVALKVMAAELSADPTFGERFLREAKALASLNHQHVLTVHDFGEVDGLFYLVTEFIDGLNLRQLMGLGELSPAEALRITPQICQALQFAHEHGIVHRDIKPENILVDAQGQLKIADFGLAKIARPDDPVALTQSSDVFGTPHYMAPEQWRGSGQVDHRADIYSLGVVLYEMLTGQLPLGHFDPPSDRDGVPRGLDEVVRRTLAQRPENRYQHAREVQTDVERQADSLRNSNRGSPGESLRGSTHDQPTPSAKPQSSRLEWLPIGALTWLVLLSGAALAFSMVLYGDQASRAIAEMQGVEPDTSLTTLTDTAAARRLLTAALCIGLLLVVILGCWSVNRIRSSGGARHGLGLAVFSTWIVPLGLLGALLTIPVSSIDNSDLRLIVGLSFGALWLVGGIAFLISRVRAEQRQLAAGVMPRWSNGPFITLLTLGFLGLAGVVGSFGLLQSATPPRPRLTVHVPVISADLIGVSRTKLLDQLGAPLSIQVSAAGQDWFYRGADGETEVYLTLDGNAVVSFSQLAELTPGTAPNQIPHLGQSLSSVIAKLGEPIDRTVGQLTSEYRFRGGLVVVSAHSLVVGIKR